MAIPCDPPTIQVDVTFLSDLRRFLPRGSDGSRACTLVAGATVGDLLATIGIPASTELTVGVNGALAARDTPLPDHATILLVSPMEGGAAAAGEATSPTPEGGSRSRRRGDQPDTKRGSRDGAPRLLEPDPARSPRRPADVGRGAGRPVRPPPRGRTRAHRPLSARARPAGGGPSRPRQPPRLRARRDHGRPRARRGASQRRRPLAAHRGLRRVGVRRLLGRRAQAGGLGSARRPRRLGHPRLSLDQRWRHRAPRRRPPLGPRHGRGRGGVLAELGDPRIRVAQIGPAGERLVRFACIANDLNEVAGRTGMGAVMGAKRLKAVAVRGHQPLRIADPQALQAVARWVSSTLEEKHRAYHEFGTGSAMQGKNLEGGMPVLNYRLGASDTVARVDAVAVRDQVRVKMTSCFACSVRCKKVVHVERQEEAAREAEQRLYRGRARVAVDPPGRYRVDPRYGGPEYESLAALGMDTISLGATLAWAMECFEKGLLTLEDTGGLPLRFHDADGVVRLVELIARREGVGDLLAEGSQRAAARIGRGTGAFLTTVKGMEMAMHDPRHMPIMRASYLLAPTGGDHMRQSGPRNGLRNQVGLCHFLAYDDDQTLAILRAVTGWDVTAEELATMARRGLTLARLFNLREGFTRADDRLPPRFGDPLPKHPGPGREQQEQIVTDYYVEQGWDPETGVPTRATIRDLGIEADAATAGAGRPAAAAAGASCTPR